MASLELDNYDVPEAALELEVSKDEQTLHSQARWEMFMNVLNEAKVITVSGSKMIESIMQDTTDLQNKYYDKCHSKSGGHVKGGGGGGGSFSRSYDKNCK